MRKSLAHAIRFRLQVNIAIDVDSVQFSARYNSTLPLLDDVPGLMCKMRLRARTKMNLSSLRDRLGIKQRWRRRVPMHLYIRQIHTGYPFQILLQ